MISKLVEVILLEIKLNGRVRCKTSKNVSL